MDLVVTAEIQLDFHVLEELAEAVVVAQVALVLLQMVQIVLLRLALLVV
jgi:hypothetical protein